MLAVRSVVFAFAAFVATTEALECAGDMFGEVTPDEVHLDPTHLPPGYPVFSVYLPDACKNNKKRQIGVYVQACDESPPSVKVISAYSAKVIREGGLQNVAYVNTTVYCVGDDPAPTIADKKNSRILIKPHKQ